MKYNNLEATLHARLASTFPDVLIKWPNMQFTEAQETTQWVWPRMIDGQAQSANLGDGGLNFINSIYQVSIYTPRNTGTETANYYVEGLLQAFPKGERLSFDGGVIILGVAYRSTAFNEDSFLHTPVTIPFTAHMEI